MTIDNNMNYFMVSFKYPGPYSNFPGVNQLADLASEVAEITASKLLDMIMVRMDDSGTITYNGQHLHAYGWTDGSLYKYVRTTLSQSSLTKELNNCFKYLTTLSLDEITKIDSNSDPNKTGCKKLEQYFQNNPDTTLVV